jgi:multimeric flavodoxin WrbA
MKSVILDGFATENLVGQTLKGMLDKDGSCSHFKLKDMNILLCKSCGVCAFKTPGECVFKDDMPIILRELAKSDLFVILTPIQFGGYSSQLKKGMDKLGLMGLPLYMVKGGHLLHPMRYGKKVLLGVGVVEEGQQGQEESFRKLVSRNALNMQNPYITVVLNSTDDQTKIELGLMNALREVRQS